MKIKFTQLAIQDLEAARSYIHQDNPNAALSVMQQVMDSVENITAFPSIGRSGRVPHTKELVVSGTPFIIVYQIRQDTLFIIRVIHTARKWP